MVHPVFPVAFWLGGMPELIIIPVGIKSGSTCSFHVVTTANLNISFNSEDAQLVVVAKDGAEHDYKDV